MGREIVIPGKTSTTQSAKSSKSVKTSTTETQQSLKTSTTETRQSVKTSSSASRQSLKTLSTEAQQSLKTSTTKTQQSVKTSSSASRQSVKALSTEAQQSVKTSTTEIQQSVISLPSATDEIQRLRFNFDLVKVKAAIPSAFKAKDSDPLEVHIRIQQRNPEKILTTVQGFKPKYYCVKILEDLKKELRCRGEVVADEKLRGVIQLQGDQRKKVFNFLIEAGIAEKEQIKIHGF